MYIQPPSWSPSSSSPYANTNEYTYDPNLAFPSIPLSSPLAVPGPVSPFHYPEEGLIYYYPYPHLHQPHSLYTHAYPYPLSNSNSNTLASPAGSFDSATTSSETSVSAIGSSPTFPSPDQWLTPPSTGNSFSSNDSVEADDDTDNVYRPHFERPGQVKSSGARPKIVIPVTTTTVTDNINGLVAPASSPTSAMAMAMEAASSPTSPMASVATTGTSSTTPSGSSSTPKCLSPETDPKPKSMSKLRKDLNREAKYKTKPCKFWKARGACPRGDECTFMHGEDDKGWPHNTSTSANSVSNDSQSQSSPVSSTSSDGGNVKHQLPSKPLSELEEKRQRGFFPINWRVIGGGVLMGKPGKQQEQSKEEKGCQMDLNKDLDNSVHANDLTLSSITFPTSKVEENRDSVDSESGSELEVPFDSVWDRIQAPRSATFDSRREEEKNNDILEGDIDGRGSQRARATSIPSTPRAALFLDSAKLFAAAESPGNL
ncbi:hypothetical protein K435DRAFT_775181 [Dendrothele bispora CBS 962.96]|uniref:C3H1-type domain-containing protein n=1 Tax=Dendrothele bispora (strain CBS 962.96) TaxID=1314807 RepID=A0A4S8MKK4_DENBC|nr:hypothetical protein K435DRAFT_775181 [Dendrothele bispora CBS 962.96]